MIRDTREIAQLERPRAGQVLSMTLLVSFAWLPLIADVVSGVSSYIGLLIALRLVSLHRPSLVPGRWLLLPLTLGGMATVLSTYRTFAGPQAGTALLATMLALKLLEMHRLRDLRITTILYGFLLVTQFLFDQSFPRALYLALLLVLDFALMADLTERTGQGRQALIFAARRAGLLAVQALPLALALFFVFPRLSAPLWSMPRPEHRERTGMSDWMEPGSINEMVLSSDPAFRVKFHGPVPGSDKLYWRGPLAWYSDGRRWTGWPPGPPLGEAEPLVETSEKISYQIELEPSGKQWLFALDMPVRVSGKARILGDFQVVTSEPIRQSQAFQVVSALRYNTGELDLDQERVGTQLPDNVTPRMRALVAGWQEHAEGPADLVRLALELFRKEPFYYSLSPPRLGANPADEFLFETREGFCEHYADSFALLMRIAGIPSRVVLGYMGGEHNAIGDYLIVRQSDAHAWVEVWLPTMGWVRIDPTAAIAPERVEGSELFQGLAAGAPLRFRLKQVNTLVGWVHELGLLGDAFERGWRDWVVDLTNARQRRMLDNLGLGPLKEYGFAIALAVSAVLTLGLLLAVLTRTSGPRDPLERIYSRFCSRLFRIGLGRRSSEGPIDYSRRVITARPDLTEPVTSFIALYLPQRYGGLQGPDDRQRLARSLQRFRPRRHFNVTEPRARNWNELSK
jgi:transglutaminase-like putative cysteine protease